MAPLRSLLAKYPRDVFVQRRYQDVFRLRLNMHEEFDRAFEIYRARPEDPVYQYLEARLMGGFNAIKAEDLLESVISRNPSFSWPHLALADLADGMGRRNAKKSETHVRAFIQACPASVEGYAMLHLVEDPELIRTGATKLRTELEARRTPSTLKYWRNLWDLEFRVAKQKSHQPDLRRVLADVEALKRLPPLPADEWSRTFSYAFELTKNESIKTWMEATIRSRLPESQLAFRLDRDHWLKKNLPLSVGVASVGDSSSHEGSQRCVMLADRLGKDTELLFERWQALRQSTDPVEEKLVIVDAYRVLREKSPDSGFSVPPLSTIIADLYVNWRVRLEQVPGLAEQGLREMEMAMKYRPDISMIPKEMRDRVVLQPDPVSITRLRSDLIFADYYLVTKQAEKARDAVMHGLADLHQSEAASARDPRQDNSQRYLEHEWLFRKASLAELEGRDQEALSLYRQFLQPITKEALTGRRMSPEWYSRIAIVKRLYLETGGDSSAWIDWATSNSSEQPKFTVVPLSFTTPLSEFEAKDIRGKTWRLADLKGKVTYIYVWATWCGPCRAGHPEVERLHDRLKNRKDLQLLTFSIDENAYLVESYISEKRYTFPVIVSHNLVSELFPTLGIPVGWIIDAEGRRSSPLGLFDTGRIVEELEKAATTPIN